MLEKALETLIMSGLEGVIIFLLFYAIYKAAYPLLTAYIASIKDVTDNNRLYAENVSKLADNIAEMNKTILQQDERIIREIQELKV